MIFNIPIAGKRNVSCVFLGAPGETLTIQQNGVTVATVAENTAIELKQGKYTVTGSISGDKEITIKAAGAYAVYPDGAIYWYGREVVPMSTTINAAYSTGNATERDNYIELYGWTRANTVESSIAHTVTETTVDTSGYSSIKFDVTPVYYSKTAGGVAQFNCGYKTSASYAEAFTGTTIAESGDRTTYTVAAPGSAVYIGARSNTSWGGYIGNKQMQAYVHAIWME